MKRNLWLLPLVTLFYLLPSGLRWLWQPDETRYAEISREMLQRGDWVVPHLLGLRYFEKPVAGYWINNLSQLLLGDSNLAVRAGSMFSTLLGAGVLYLLARRMRLPAQTALAAALIYLTCFIVYAVGTYAALDAMLALWLTVAMYCFYEASRAVTARGKAIGYLALGLACGMGVMTKGFLALAIPVIGVLPWVIQQKRLKELLLFGPLAVISATLITLPWALAVARQEPDYWHYFFWVEHIQRFSGDDAQHKAPFWFFVPILLAGVLPWAGLLPGALHLGWRQRRENPEYFYLLSWAVMPFLLFSAAKGKLPTYILPCFAPLALLFAIYAQTILQNAQLRALRINSLINLALGLLLALAMLIAGNGWLMKDIYNPGENWKMLLGIAAFGGWALIGWLVWRKAQSRWLWTAFCPLLAGLLIGFALPQDRIFSKQPQVFIRNMLPLLKQSRAVASDDVGLAAGLAWELKRSDITMYRQKGELTYGLDYPDARGRFVEEKQFGQWLQQQRQQGNVSLVLMLPKDGMDQTLPSADQTCRRGRYILLFYRQRAATP